MITNKMKLNNQIVKMKRIKDINNMLKDFSELESKYEDLKILFVFLNDNEVDEQTFEKELTTNHFLLSKPFFSASA